MYLTVVRALVQIQRKLWPLRSAGWGYIYIESPERDKRGSVPGLMADPISVWGSPTWYSALRCTPPIFALDHHRPPARFPFATFNIACRTSQTVYICPIFAFIVVDFEGEVQNLRRCGSGQYVGLCVSIRWQKSVRRVAFFSFCRVADLSGKCWYDHYFFVGDELSQERS